jgi:uncharacterized membrane protein YfcA
MGSSDAAAGLSGEKSGLRYGVIGLVGGFFSGLLGIGGGLVMVPLLVYWQGGQQRWAHAMSLAAIIPISFGAVLIYGAAGNVDVPAAIALTIGAVAGARLGTGLLVRAPEHILKGAFGVFMLGAAVAVVLKG